MFKSNTKYCQKLHRNCLSLSFPSHHQRWPSNRFENITLHVIPYRQYRNSTVLYSRPSDSRESIHCPLFCPRPCCLCCRFAGTTSCGTWLSFYNFHLKFSNHFKTPVLSCKQFLFAAWISPPSASLRTSNIHKSHCHSVSLHFQCNSCHGVLQEREDEVHGWWWPWQYRTWGLWGFR